METIWKPYGIHMVENPLFSNNRRLYSLFHCSPCYCPSTI